MREAAQVFVRWRRGTYLAIMGEQNGVGLDVSVDDAIGVEESKGLEACLANSGDLLFIQSVNANRGNKLKEWSQWSGCRGNGRRCSP